MIKTIFDTGASNLIPSNIDGSIYSLIGQDCVIDKGNKFAITYNSGSLKINFSADDVAYIGGSFFWIKTATEYTLPSNSTCYVVARIDPTQAVDSTGFITYVSTSSAVQKGNVNASQIRDLLLYKIRTSSTGVISVEDRRVIKGSGTSVGGYGIWVGTQAEYNAISSKDNNTLYFIKE